MVLKIKKIIFLVSLSVLLSACPPPPKDQFYNNTTETLVVIGVREEIIWPAGSVFDVKKLTQAFFGRNQKLRIEGRVQCMFPAYFRIKDMEGRILVYAVNPVLSPNIVFERAPEGGRQILRVQLNQDRNFYNVPFGIEFPAQLSALRNRRPSLSRFSSVPEHDPDCVN